MIIEINYDKLLQTHQCKDQALTAYKAALPAY